MMVHARGNGNWLHPKTGHAVAHGIDSAKARHFEKSHIPHIN
jgi:hypothetical protein